MISAKNLHENTNLARNKWHIQDNNVVIITQSTGYHSENREMEDDDDDGWCKPTNFEGTFNASQFHCIISAPKQGVMYTKQHPPYLALTVEIWYGVTCAFKTLP